MEIRYLDSPVKTSFNGEKSEIIKAKNLLKEFYAETGVQRTISDVIRVTIQRFNEDPDFRKMVLSFLKTQEGYNEAN